MIEPAKPIVKRNMMVQAEMWSHHLHDNVISLPMRACSIGCVVAFTLKKEIYNTH